MAHWKRISAGGRAAPYSRFGESNFSQLVSTEISVTNDHWKSRVRLDQREQAKE